MPTLMQALLAALLKLQEGAVAVEPVSGREGAFAILEARVSPAGTVEAVKW